MKHKDDERFTSKRLWNKQEDQLLLQIVGDSPAPKWSAVSTEFNALARKQGSSSTSMRTNKQCRERWQNHLNPALKNHLPWSEQEHQALFRLFRSHSHQWCELSSQLESQGFQKRGQNNIKNYFYAAVKTQIKRINEVIRQNNRQTKQRKSQLYQYQQKYAYKQRLSLERQILGRNHDTNSEEHNRPPPTHTSEEPPTPNNDLAFDSDHPQGDLHIVKQLDHELISKILLIAQQKGNKKFVISTSRSLHYHRSAQQLRDQLIELIVQRSQPLQKQTVLQLAIDMLLISKHCKRKVQKNQTPLPEPVPTNHPDKSILNPVITPQKIEDQPLPTQERLPAREEPPAQSFNERATLQKFFLEDKPPKCWNLELGKASQQYAPLPLPRDDNLNLNPFHLFSSFDFARQYLDRSSELMERSGLSNFSILGCFEPLQVSSFSHDQQEPPHPPALSFINSIREVKQQQQQRISTPMEFPPPSFNPCQGFSYFPMIDPEKQVLYSSQPAYTHNLNSHNFNTLNNHNHSPFRQPTPDKERNHYDNNDPFLAHSWAYSVPVVESKQRLNSTHSNHSHHSHHSNHSNHSNRSLSNHSDRIPTLTNNKEEWGFALPKSNFYQFDHFDR